jgi:hypothetical protein
MAAGGREAAINFTSLVQAKEEVGRAGMKRHQTPTNNITL